MPPALLCCAQHRSCTKGAPNSEGVEDADDVDDLTSLMTAERRANIAGDRLVARME